MMHLKRKLATALYRNSPLSFVNFLHLHRTQNNIANWQQAPFYFFHIPKCAGKSICNAVGFKDPGHTTIEDLPKTTVKWILNKPILTVWRDPIDRLVSTFKYAHKHRINRTPTTIMFISKFDDVDSFVDFLWHNQHYRKHYFLRPASEYIQPLTSLNANLTVLDFKEINGNVKKYLNSYGLNIKDIPSINQSKSVQYSGNLNFIPSKETKDKIRRLYYVDYQIKPIIRSSLL